MNVLKLTAQETIQTILDQALGANKAKATAQNAILYTFPEVHHGCNEMEVGTWSVGAKGIHVYTSIDYNDAYEHLKNGSKPDRFKPIKLSFDTMFGAVTGRTPA